MSWAGVTSLLAMLPISNRPACRSMSFAFPADAGVGERRGRSCGRRRLGLGRPAEQRGRLLGGLRDSSRLCSDPFAQRFVSRRWQLAVAASRIGAVRRTVEVLYDRVAGPGPRASAVARTRLIDDIVADALPRIGQVVILGAGFDSRAYRLPGLAEITVFEVDHPATQQAKREWEGVTNYLTPAAVDATLCAMHGLAVAGSLLVFTMLTAWF
jgi:O-methyltransferase involved in polyketide biosynthesis